MVSSSVSSMLFPSIKLHQLYSINICDEIDIIFENLDMIDLASLQSVITSKSYDIVDIVPNILSVDTINKTITLSGFKINDTTYIVTKQGTNNIIIYNCSKHNIETGIEYLYNICNNMLK